jgi:two-component system OmpR family response regulator
MTATSREGPANAGPTDILVVEDDRDQAEELVAWLRGHGFRACAAADAEAAVAVILASHPRLLLVDINMPAIDGLRLSHLVSAFDQRSAIILMSGDSAAVDRAKLPGGVAFDVVAKPIALEWLLGVAEALAPRAAEAGPPAT